MAKNARSPALENRTVTVRKPNSGYRTREHLRDDEMAKLLEAARGNRYGHRDYTMLLMTWRHGLRASELCDLEWSTIDFKGSIHIRRIKLGKPTTHPLLGDEIRALRRLQREQDPKSAWVFTTENGGPFTPDGFNKLVKRLGKSVVPFPIHAHMLRHSTGYHLADRDRSTRLIQDYLGHRSIQSTVRYTELAPTRFKNIWE